MDAYIEARLKWYRQNRSDDSAIIRELIAMQVWLDQVADPTGPRQPTLHVFAVPLGEVEHVSRAVTIAVYTVHPATTTLDDAISQAHGLLVRKEITQTEFKTIIDFLYARYTQVTVPPTAGWVGAFVETVEG